MNTKIHPFIFILLLIFVSTFINCSSGGSSDPFINFNENPPAASLLGYWETDYTVEENSCNTAYPTDEIIEVTSDGCQVVSWSSIGSIGSTMPPYEYTCKTSDKSILLTKEYHNTCPDTDYVKTVQLTLDEDSGELKGTFTQTKKSLECGSDVYDTDCEYSGTVIGIETIYDSYIPGEDDDNDGILSDGDGSGVWHDNPCTGGNTTNCDDNCAWTANSDQSDIDGDGMGDVCDADIDGDGIRDDGSNSGTAGDAPCTGG
ncbi:hypothetical protein KJ708_10490, partial [bacterium]|nr:hypothetical protein [bacterium]MBU1918223.1 hypothetical protein [bacterium]